MVLDNEKQKELLLGMIKSLTFSGEFVEDFYNLKKAVENAVLAGEKITDPIKK
jgi:hypothetical protein